MGAGSPAGAILLCALRPRICSCACLPAGFRLGAGPFASRHSQGHFFNLRRKVFVFESQNQTFL